MKRLLLIAPLASACTLQAGEGFSALREGTVVFALEAGAARDLGNSVILTNQGSRVRFRSLQLSVGALRLQTLQAGGSGGTFDPADPPEGYTLCHGGHCHSVSGELVSYEDVQQQLAGGAAAFSTLAEVDMSFEPLLISPDETVDTQIADVDDLPLGLATITQVGLEVTAIAGSLELLDTTGAVVRELPFALPLAVELRKTASVSLDRDGPAHLSPRFSIVVDGTVLDDVDFSDALESSDYAVDAEEPIGARLLRVQEAVTTTVSF